MIGSCGWCMRYYTPWQRARNAGSMGEFMYTLSCMVRHWMLYCVWTVICMRPSIQWLSYPPFFCSGWFNSSPTSGVAMNRFFLMICLLERVISKNWSPFRSFESILNFQICYIIDFLDHPNQLDNLFFTHFGPIPRVEQDL